MKKTLTLFLLFAVLQTTAQNVGINNSDPQLPLDILKTGGGNMIRLLNPSSTTGAASGLLFTNSASYGIPGFSSASIVAQRRASGGHDMIFSVSPTNGAALERMRIDSFGNILINQGRIGIGSSTPSYDLYINRNSPGIGFYDDDDDHFSGFIAGDSTDLFINAHRRPNVFPPSGEPGNLILQVNGTGFINSTAGKVGIGTASPEAKLHIANNVMIGTGIPATGYLLSVNGKIISEEVRVQLDADWPDYVFDENYRLMPIKELEKFVQDMQHLPNIPSAKEISKNGLLLGDMQKRIMEKVEELTLYIIQLDKENKQLRQELDTLRSTLQKN